MTPAPAVRDRAALTSAAAFAGPMLFSVVVAALLPHDRPGAGLLAALVLALVAGAVVLRLGAEPEQDWRVVVGPLLCCGVVAVLRHVEGGAESGFSYLLLVPLFWVSLHGRPQHLATVLAATLAVLVVPVIAVGPPLYPQGEWRRALVWLAVAPVASYTVQRLVRHTQVAADLLRGNEHVMVRVAQVVRDLPRDPQRARYDICKAARELAGADLAFLCEPDGLGNLASTVRVGNGLPAFSVPLGGETSGTATAFHSRRVYFTEDPAHDPVASQRLVQQMGARAVLFCPVLRSDEPLGVLAVIWTRPTTVPLSRVTTAVELLANEAAAAIERADLLARLTNQSQTDALTGLANRRFWDEALEQALLRAGRQHKPVCVGLVDLDHFKAYNDTYGHQQGDQLLKEAAASWRAQLRETDVLARWGGEEFAVLLPDCGLSTATRVLERLRTAMPRGQHCSIGLATWDGQQESGALMAAADAALYAAKQAGRNRIMTLG